MPEQRIVLVRHGRTASNAAGVWQGHLDTPLDEVGTAQAAATAAALAEVESPVRLLSSDLSRAVATASPLGAAWGLPVESDEALREVNAGAWEGLSRDEIARDWADDLAGWRAGDDVRIGGAERMSEAGARVAAAIDTYAQATAGTLVIVSHGGCIRMATMQLCGLGTAGRALRVLRNAHWAVLVRGPSGLFSLDGWNLGPELTVAAPAVP